MFTFFKAKRLLLRSLTADQLRSTIPQRDVRVPRRSPQTGDPSIHPAALYELRIKLETRLIDPAVPDIIPYAIVLEGAERQRGRLAQMLALSKQQAHPLGDRPLVVLTRGVEWSQGLQEAHSVVGAAIHQFAPYRRRGRGP